MEFQLVEFDPFSNSTGIQEPTSDYNYTEFLDNSSYKNEVPENITINVESERLQDLVYLSMYSSTCLAALFGNLLVCKVVFVKPSMRNFTNLLLANMAISDVLCALMFPTGLFVCWDYFISHTGNHACITAKVVQLLSFQVSSVTMTVVAVDRFMLVNFPLIRSHRFVPVSAFIFAVWIVSLIIIIATSPSLAFHRFFVPEEAYIKCETALVFGDHVLPAKEQRIRLIVANLSHFWIPLTIIFACYGSIAWKVLHRKVGDMTTSQQNNLLRAKWKTIKMLIAAVAVFFLCWFPFFILNLLDFVGNPNRGRPCNKSGPFFIAVWMAFTSCCWNPFVYWIYSDDFREGLKDFGKCMTMKWRFTVCTRNSEEANDKSEDPVQRQRTRTMSSHLDVDP